MTRYIGAAVLAVIWVATTGSFTIVNLIFGFLLGLVCRHIVREQRGVQWRRMRPGKLAVLAAIFVRELILSAWRVARLVVSPGMDLKPGIFAYHLGVQRDFEITLLANLITLTPGTLSVDVSEDRRTLYVHALDCSDVEQTRRDIEQAFERRIAEAFPQ